MKHRSEYHFDAKGSSAIQSVTYRSDTHMLYVHMRDHTSIEYSGVSLDTFQEFRDADSKGQFYNLHIRSEYPYRNL